MCPPETTSASRGNSDLPIAFLALLEQNGVDVTFKMIHGDQRLVEREGQRLGVADADQQGAGQARSLSYRQRIDRLISLPGIVKRFADYRHNRLQVLARSQFRDNSAIRLVRGDLREHHVRNQFLARAHNRRRGFVAGAFNAKNVRVHSLS